MAAIVPLFSTLSADTHFYSEPPKEKPVSEQLEIIIQKMDVLEDILKFIKEEFSNSYELDASAPTHPRIESTSW